jgi:molybdenum cofactor biosynthesis enzyme MoaA
VVQLIKGRKEIVITGGEHLLGRDIFHNLEICHNLKFKQILFLTNGTLLTQKNRGNLGRN